MTQKTHYDIPLSIKNQEWPGVLGDSQKQQMTYEEFLDTNRKQAHRLLHAGRNIG